MLIFSHIEEYLISQLASAKESICVYCPFIKRSALERLLKAVPESLEIQIVTTWRTSTFLQGGSDIEIFPFCIENGIELRRQDTLHAKIWLLDSSIIIAGSANISDRALGSGHCPNFEFVTEAFEATPNELNTLDKLYCAALQITDDDYSKMRTALEASEAVEDDINDFENANTNYKFQDTLLLPITRSPGELWVEYQKPPEIRSAGAAADLAAYSVPPGLNERLFVQVLAKSFLPSALVQGVTDQLRIRDLYWHDVKSWLREYIPEVADRSELNRQVDIIYNWLPALSDKYEVTQPKVSERLAYNTNLGPGQILRARGPREKKIEHESNRHE